MQSIYICPVIVLRMSFDIIIKKPLELLLIQVREE
jgi:hypothetical protein